MDIDLDNIELFDMISSPLPEIDPNILDFDDDDLLPVNEIMNNQDTGEDGGQEQTEENSPSSDQVEEVVNINNTAGNDCEVALNLSKDAMVSSPVITYPEPFIRPMPREPYYAAQPTTSWAYRPEPPTFAAPMPPNPAFLPERKLHYQHEMLNNTEEESISTLSELCQLARQRKEIFEQEEQENEESPIDDSKQASPDSQSNAQGEQPDPDDRPVIEEVIPEAQKSSEVKNSILVSLLRERELIDRMATLNRFHLSLFSNRSEYTHPLPIVPIPYRFPTTSFDFATQANMLSGHWAVPGCRTVNPRFLALLSVLPRVSAPLKAP